MKIKCDQKELLKGINAVIRACGLKSKDNAFVECLHLVPAEEELLIEATNMSLSIQTKVKASVEGSTKKGIAVSNRYFSDIIRNMPDTELELDVLEKEIVVKARKSEYSIPYLDGAGFPTNPDVIEKFSFEISAEHLRDAVQKTSFSAAIEESRPIITGELLEIKEGNMNLVATDGYRISVCTVPIKKIKGEDGSAVVPRKALEEMQKLSISSPVKITIGEKNVQVEVGQTKITSRLLEGEYLKYEQVFNQANTDIKVAVEREELLESVSRTMLVAKEDSKKNSTTFKITKNTLFLTSTGVGKGKEELEIESIGGELEIAFNPKYIVDVLRAIDGETIGLGFGTDQTPLICVGENYKYLILPVRLQ